jgi:hypothetical protein
MATSTYTKLLERTQELLPDEQVHYVVIGNISPPASGLLAMMTGGFSLFLRRNRVVAITDRHFVVFKTGIFRWNVFKPNQELFRVSRRKFGELSGYQTTIKLGTEKLRFRQPWYEYMRAADADLEGAGSQDAVPAPETL